MSGGYNSHSNTKGTSWSLSLSLPLWPQALPLSGGGMAWMSQKVLLCSQNLLQYHLFYGTVFPWGRQR